MPYWLRLLLFVLVADVVVLALAVWLSPLGPFVNDLLAVGGMFLAIPVGRRVLRRKTL